MNNFIVTAHGWSASNWVAHSLNQHPDVICTHSARNELADDKDLQSDRNLKLNLRQLHSGYINRQKQSLDDLYDEIASKGTSKYYGSVHVLRLRDIPVIVDKFSSPIRQFNLANIVRHPVDLVWSGYGQFQTLFKYDINEMYWTVGKILRDGKELCYYLVDKYDLNLGEMECLTFLGACAIMSSLKLDLEAYKGINNISNINFVGTYQMELLTSDRNEFKYFVETLTGDSVCTNEYLDKVFNAGVINKHKSDSKKLSPADRYNSFCPWQKDSFNYFFNFNSLQSDYGSFGYDLNFIPAND
ncbi:MAG: hypothetical protein R2820_02365 [Cyclobacteriaceae bacterium]